MKKILLILALVCFGLKANWTPMTYNECKKTCGGSDMMYWQGSNSPFDFGTQGLCNCNG